MPVGDDNDEDDEVPLVRNCGTGAVHQRLLRESPEYMAARNASENAFFLFANRLRAGSRTGVTVIPVVVHVVHHDATQDISDAQVRSQIAVLNEDFRKANADVASTPAPFAPLAADARIEFALATTDPSGNPTSGITRTSTTVDGFTDDDKVKRNATGGHDAWPSDKYLNLWCCRLAGGLLGYAQFPGGPAGTDGVVIRDTAFGNTGTARAPFNLGRTATHEIGHWLNLRHIWGDDGNGCSGDDFVADTPNCAGSNGGVPAFPHITCNNGPNGDMFMNYMDYTDDRGMFMFTAGQVLRMQASLDNDRPTIGTTKAGPTLTFSDVQPTLAAQDVKPTVVSVDVQPTLAAQDVKPTVVSIDVQPTATVLDRPPTVAHLDVRPTLQVLDVGVPRPPFPPRPPVGPGPGPGPGPGVAPFVLATPHHTMAWTQSFPALAQAEVASLQAQIAASEQVLAEFAEADAAGLLSNTEAADAEGVYAEHQRLVAELEQLTAGA